MGIINEQHSVFRPLVIAKAITPGLIRRDCGVVIFDPISIDGYMHKLVRNDIDNIAYNTRSMGRGVFTIGEDGTILNYKGVDSRLIIGEVKKHNISNLLWGTHDRHEIDMVFFEHGSYSGHSKNPQIRVKGASQLQDLIYERDKISEFQQHPLIKLPQMIEVKAFSREFCQKYRLPDLIGTTEMFLHQMEMADKEDDKRGIVGKSRLESLKKMQNVGLPCNQRNQTWSEYFRTLSSQEKCVLRGIKDFWIAVTEEDSRYGLGASFGQAVRILESPFRISDLAYCIETKDKEAVQSILDYTRRQYSANYLNYYAETMGKNVAGFMNEGLANHLWSHRQDFALSAEICDDAFNDVRKNLQQETSVEQYEKLRNVIDNCHNDGQTPKDIADEYKRQSHIMADKVKYYAQVFLFVSNMKVLEDAYNLVGYQINAGYVDRFVEAFVYGLENKDEIVEAIIPWYRQLFGEKGTLDHYLGMRARNSIKGFEEYINSFYHRLVEMV